MYIKLQVKRYDFQKGQKLFFVMCVTFSNDISVICVTYIARYYFLYRVVYWDLSTGGAKVCLDHRFRAHCPNANAASIPSQQSV